MLAQAYIKDRTVYLLLGISILVFLFLKLDHLTLPHYWDEAWSYATAVQAMYESGPSLLPGNVDPQFTRGHPLLFYFLSSSWMTIFGTTLWSKHLFAMMVSLLFVVAMFRIGSLLFQQKFWGLTVAVIWMAQSMFFVQSSMLLPEVLVALLAILSIAAFALGKWWQLALYLSLLLLTKESGFMFLAGIGIVGLLIAIKEKSMPYFKQLFLSLLIPVVVVTSFFVYQYSVFGWVFFPEHIGMIKLTLGYFGGNLSTILSLKQYYPMIFISALFGIFIYLKNKSKLGLILSLLLLALSLFTKLSGILGGNYNLILVLLFAVGFVISLGVFYREVNRGMRSATFIGTAVICSFLYLAFCAMNFFTVRYLMPYTAVLIIGIAYQCYLLSELYATKPMVKYAFLLPFALSVVSMITNKNNGDVSIGAFNAVRLQRNLIDYMVANVPVDAKIGWGSFQMSVNIVNPACGFIPNKASAYQHLDWTIDSATQYVIFDNIEPDPREEELRQGSDFEQLFETTLNGVVGRVYKRKTVTN